MRDNKTQVSHAIFYCHDCALGRAWLSIVNLASLALRPGSLIIILEVTGHSVSNRRTYCQQWWRSVYSDFSEFTSDSWEILLSYLTFLAVINFIDSS